MVIVAITLIQSCGNIHHYYAGGYENSQRYQVSEADLAQVARHTKFSPNERYSSGTPLPPWGKPVGQSVLWLQFNQLPPLGVRIAVNVSQEYVVYDPKSYAIKSQNGTGKTGSTSTVKTESKSPTVKSEIKPALVTESKAQPKSVSEPKSKPESESKPKPESKSAQARKKEMAALEEAMAKLNSKPNSLPESKSDIKSEMKAEPKSEPKPESNAESKSDSKTELKIEIKSEPSPKPEFIFSSNLNSEFNSEFKFVEPELTFGSGLKPELESESNKKPKAEIQSELKSEPKFEPKVNEENLLSNSNPSSSLPVEITKEFATNQLATLLQELQGIRIRKAQVQQQIDELLPIILQK